MPRCSLSKTFQTSIKIDVQRGVQIDALLDDVPQSEDTNLSTIFVLNCINSHSTHEVNYNIIVVNLLAVF